MSAPGREDFLLDPPTGAVRHPDRPRRAVSQRRVAALGGQVAVAVEDAVTIEQAAAGSEPGLVQDLRTAARCLRAALRAEGFAVQESEMHIVPVVVGEQRATSRLCEAALARGVFAQAIRPPTVPAGTSRLRLAAMASHSPRVWHATSPRHGP